MTNEEARVVNRQGMSGDNELNGVQTYQLTPQNGVKLIEGHKSDVYQVAWNPRKRMLASG